MYSSRFTSCILTFILITIGNAVPDFNVPTTIKAGKDISFLRNYFIAPMESYRVYLGATAPYSKLSPICFLTPKKPAETTGDRTNTINIPADIGPPTSYHILIHSWSAQKTGGYYITISNPFTLTSTTLSNWTDAEEIHIRLSDNLPCTSFNCQRQCVEERNLEHANVTYLSNRKYCRCVRKCPGVVTEDADFGDGCGWEWRWQDEGIDPDGGSTSTSGGVVSSKTVSGKGSSTKTTEYVGTNFPTISKTELSSSTSSTGSLLGIAVTPTSSPTLGGTASTPTPSKSNARRTRAVNFGFAVVVGTFLMML